MEQFAPAHDDEFISFVKTPRKIAITGAGGRLGAALAREYGREFAVGAWGRAQLDLAQPENVHAALATADFDLLINCAAQTNVDRCETEGAEAMAINRDGPRLLAEICRARGARLLHISTDYVFDGKQTAPYREDDVARPRSVYGESKLAGEAAVLAADPANMVVRVSWVFGPDRPSFVDGMLERARRETPVGAVADKFSTPSYTLDLAKMLQQLFTNENARGLFHLANAGACSWQEYAQHAVTTFHSLGGKLAARTIEPLALAQMTAFVAPRPRHTVLATDKFTALTGMKPRPWQEAVSEYVRDFVAR